MALGLAALWYSGPLVALAVSLLVVVVGRAIQEARRLGAIRLEAEVTLFRSGHNQEHDVWVAVPGGAVIESTDPATPSYVRLRYAAPMPESVRLQIEEQLRDGGTEGTRKLSDSERAELPRRVPSQNSEDNIVFNLLVFAAPIQVGVFTKSWIAFVIAALVLTPLMILVQRRRRTQFASQTEVKIVADANVLGSRARWAEHLGDDEKRPWTVDGRPAWWRIE